MQQLVHALILRWPNVKSQVIADQYQQLRTNSPKTRQPDLQMHCPI